MNKIVNSLSKNKAGISLMLIASLFTAIGQLQWKLSSGGINLLLFSGFTFYFMGAVFMIVSYKFGDLSVLHPLLSIGYVLALLLGAVFLNESVSIQGLIGTCIIVCGAILIGGGDD